jgi:hypothetical protein
MEEVAENNWLMDNTMSDVDRKAYVKGYLACAYNEEKLLKEFVSYLKYMNRDVYYDDAEIFLDEFKRNNYGKRIYTL